jgi:tetratricopeptide (TPR) repeat protein
VRDSLWTLVLDHRDQFSDYYQRMIDAFEAGRAQDWNRREEIVASVVQDYPGTKAAYNYALWAMAQNHAGAAVKSLESLDPDSEPMKGWWSYFAVMADAEHSLGDFDAEVAAAEAGVERFPDRVGPRVHLARALASAGRLDEIDAALAECGDLDDPLGWNMGYGLSWVGGELMAHGDLDAAQPYLDKTVAWFEGLPAEDRETVANRRNHAYALYAAGRYSEAQKEYAGLAKDYPKAIADRMRLGASAALAGDEATARESLHMIESGEINDYPPTMHGYASFITAALGDEDATFEHLSHTWVGGRWIHIEPAYVRGPMKDNPRLKSLMKPTG